MSVLVPQRREPGELFGPRFTLFADLLAVGLATAVVSLPLVTAPTALAAACTVLRRAIIEDRPATLGQYVAELRAHGLVRSLLAGATVCAVAALLVLDLLLTRAGLPGARPTFWVLTGLAAAGLVVALRTAGDPGVVRGWRGALRRTAARSAADPSGCVRVAAAVVLCLALAWMLPLLVPLLPGPLAFAVTAVELRTTTKDSRLAPPPLDEG